MTSETVLKRLSGQRSSLFKNMLVWSLPLTATAAEFWLQWWLLTKECPTETKCWWNAMAVSSIIQYFLYNGHLNVQ